MQTMSQTTIFLLALTCGVATAIAVAPPAQALTLTAVDVTLPDSERDLPDGPGLAAVEGNCVSCHTPGMILNQPVMSKAYWETAIAKMRNVYRAPISDKDVPDILNYLTAVKGMK